MTWHWEFRLPWVDHHIHHEPGNVGPLGQQWGSMATCCGDSTPGSFSRLPCCLPLYRWRSTAAAKGGRGAPRREQKVQKVTYLMFLWETEDSTWFNHWSGDLNHHQSGDLGLWTWGVPRSDHVWESLRGMPGIHPKHQATIGWLVINHWFWSNTTSSHKPKLPYVYIYIYIISLYTLIPQENLLCSFMQLLLLYDSNALSSSVSLLPQAQAFWVDVPPDRIQSDQRTLFLYVWGRMFRELHWKFNRLARCVFHLSEF